MFAGALAGALERIDGDAVAHYRDVVAALDLPTAVPGPADPDALLASMRRDKKAIGGLTFVLPGPLGLETVHDPTPAPSPSRSRAVGVGG